MDNNEGCGTYSVLIGLGAIVSIGMIIFNSCSGRSREVQPTSQVDTVLPIFDSIPIRDSTNSYAVPSVVPSQSVSSSSEYSTPDDAYDEGYSDGKSAYEEDEEGENDE